MRKIICLVLVILLTAALFTTTAFAKDFDWQRYKGTTIRWIMGTFPWVDLIEPLIPEFEKKTGIKVITDFLPEYQMRPKLTVTLTAGSKDIDVFGTIFANEGIKFYKNGWYEHLEKYVHDSTITNPDYDFSDFSPDALATTTYKGDLVGIPLFTNTQLLYLRKDLLAKAGLFAPYTYEEMELFAEKLHGIERGVYGITLRGRAAAATSQWCAVLHSMGGQWLYPDGTPAMDSPEAIEAFKWWGRILRNYGPPGSINNSWQECQRLMAMGQAAMWFDGAVLMHGVIDPQQSKVYDKITFAPMPVGKAGRISWNNCWMLSISPFSENKEAAWYLIQWATSKEKDLYVANQGVAPARKSTWMNEEYLSSGVAADYPTYLPSFAANLRGSTPWQNPPVIPVAEFRERVGEIIVAAILGEKDIEQFAKEVNKDIAALVRRYQ